MLTSVGLVTSAASLQTRCPARAEHGAAQAAVYYLLTECSFDSELIITNVSVKTTVDYRQAVRSEDLFRTYKFNKRLSHSLC